MINLEFHSIKNTYYENRVRKALIALKGQQSLADVEQIMRYALQTMPRGNNKRTASYEYKLSRVEDKAGAYLELHHEPTERKVATIKMRKQ